ncbi:unnamed protein product [Somion occarium]|uniref:Histone deacetylase interacting domain-containing protein n=1 Tax=Somion occarium TaxID=3059160 RepID=A0ABP1DLA5_9APHY
MSNEDDALRISQNLNDNAVTEQELPPLATDDPPPPPADVKMSADEPPMEHSPSGLDGPQDRQLNVTDALTYLDSVKVQFQDRPDVYNHFLDIMKDFKGQKIDTPGVIERVSNLFHGHPRLIQGFNTFLPPGYRIECTNDALNPNFITVTTPSGTTTQATDGRFHLGHLEPELTHQQIPTPGPIQPSDVELAPALSYLQSVKACFADDPDRYHRFLALLSPGRSPAYISDTVHIVAEIFKDHPDLMEGFYQFLPNERIQHQAAAKLDEILNRTKSEGKVSRKKGESSTATPTSVPQKRKRKAPEKEKEPVAKAGPSKPLKRTKQQHGEAPSPALSQRHAAVSPRRSHAHQVVQHPAPPPPPASPYDRYDSQFFDRVKRALDHRETYNEFLKVVNLFTQDIIDTAQLVRESRKFLGDGELLAQFKDILGFDERRERFAGTEDVWTRPMGVLDRPNRQRLCNQDGSYRKLPPNESLVLCSGRDDMCRSVLNDEWISQPNFTSEDSGFIAHKKNVHEEALHRSEEERHEYDFHIEAISKTILLLDPLNTKILQLSPEERLNYKKPHHLSSAKSIHQRVIKKVYGREAGMEVWQALQDVPVTAVPIVLARLKQKLEEWKRAQREWNKVWREVDARNYYKSLDHQGITFKAADKKAITTKAFMNQIETARDEQMAKRAALIDPMFARTRPRHQLEYVIDDMPVLQDALKLTCSFLDRTQGQISLTDRRRIESFLRSFVPLFFMIDPIAFNASFVPKHESIESEASEGDSVMDDTEVTSNSSARGGRSKKGGIGSAGDLRKKLLKSEQAKSSRRTRAQSAASPASSRPPSPPTDSTHADREELIPLNGEARSGPTSPVEQRPTRKGTFYTNTQFYVLLRLLEILYNRLHLFKSIATQLANAPPGPSPVAEGVGLLIDLAKLNDKAKSAAHFYDFFLESCEKLFDNEIEQAVFEEQTRHMFGVKHGYKAFTIDKLIGALIKQVQMVLSDARSQELFDLLRRERDIPALTSQDLINARKNTEKVLGPDENLFRIDWLPELKTVTMQLIGKDDSSFDDSEVLTGRWQAYIDSYVSPEPTVGVPSSAARRKPFLRRTVTPTLDGGEPMVVAHSDLALRVCVRTYRLFYVSNTEEFLFRLSSREERQRAKDALESRNIRRQAWLDKLTPPPETKEESEPSAALAEKS